MVEKKIKGKEWFTIVTPKYFNEKEIGRTFVAEPENLIGRTISISAVELTNNFEKYYMKLTFRIVKVGEKKAFTEFDGSECLSDYISRMVLRRVRRIDAVQDLTTKDNVRIRVKSLVIISRRIKSSIQARIRDFVGDRVKKEVENSTIEEFVKKVLSDELKKKILSEGRKIYPIRNFEVRKSEILH